MGVAVGCFILTLQEERMARCLAPAALQRAQETGFLIRRLTIVSSYGPPELMVWLRRVHQWKVVGRM